jgi:hypothetical protein
MKPGGFIRGAHPPSRYGDWQGANLTLGITRDTPARCREGFTDLSRMGGQDHSWPGQCYFTEAQSRKNTCFHSFLWRRLYLHLTEAS